MIHNSQIAAQVAELKEPLRSEVERLLRLAGELKTGKGSAEHRITLLYTLKQDVGRLLSGEFAGPLDEEFSNALKATFATIEDRF
jgi:hypothetical protein